MAYNPFFYQNSYPIIPPQQNNNGIIWVQGLEGAKAYPVGAGNSILLMDSDNQFMYIKTADNSGMPSLKVYEYHEVENTPKETKLDMANFVTKAELEEAIAKLKPKKKKIIEVEEDE